MALKIIIGEGRNLERFKHSSKSDLTISDFTPANHNMQITIDQLRELTDGSKNTLEIVISTDSARFIDHCIPSELIIANLIKKPSNDYELRTIPLVEMGRDYERFKEAFDVGICHVSEILRNTGIWHGSL